MASSSGGRTPRDLRGMVQTKGDDIPEELKTNLEKLRALSKDDLSENAMLRSRIDQQAELICILKQRADESTKKSLRVEKENEELNSTREQILTAMHTEARKYSVLQKRFDVLNSNHEQLITIKDDYKKHNETLRTENERLRHENQVLFADTVKKREEEIKKLRDETEQLQTRCTLAKQTQRDTEERMRALRAENERVIISLQEKLSMLEERSAGKEQETSRAVQNIRDEVEEEKRRLLGIQRERDEFAQLALERGKALQEKQIENARQLVQLEEALRTIEEMEDKFAAELETMSSVAQVRRMKKQLEEVEKRSQEQLKEYEAYKKHTSTLLAKEKKLNDKLRVLIG